ncbi:MAG TPA: hypothetical protein VF574_18600 [Allosphingosinicella sp.]|jgi:hypothetical protein
MSIEVQTTWIGLALVAPLDGSEQQSRGLKGGYGFVAYRADTIEDGIKSLRLELAEGGTDLVGFDWLSRLQDDEHELNEANAALVDRLDQYPVQFHDFHWHSESVKSRSH